MGPSATVPSPFVQVALPFGWWDTPPATESSLPQPSPGIQAQTPSRLKTTLLSIWRYTPPLQRAETLGKVAPNTHLALPQEGASSLSLSPHRNKKERGEQKSPEKRSSIATEPPFPLRGASTSLGLWLSALRSGEAGQKRSSEKK